MLDLLRALVGLGRGQVDLVERGDDREVVFHRLVAVRQRLRLDALRRVDEEDHALARGQAAAHLVAEVDVAGRVDQVHDVAVPLEADVLRLDRDAPFPLDVHRVEVLGPHVPGVHGARQLQQAIGERRLAVVDVGDDRKVADAVELSGQEDHSRERHSPASLSRLPRGWIVGENSMANIKSQKKRNLQNETRRVRNKGVRSELKTRIKVAQDGVAQGAEDADDRVRFAQKRLGKAASKGVIHKNAAARRQSRLMRRRAAKPSASARLLAARRTAPRRR